MRQHRPRQRLTRTDWWTEVGFEACRIGGIDQRSFGCVHDRSAAHRDDAIEVGILEKVGGGEHRAIGRLDPHLGKDRHIDAGRRERRPCAREMLAVDEIGIGENRRPADAPAQGAFADLLQHTAPERGSRHLHRECPRPTVGWGEILAATHVQPS